MSRANIVLAGLLLAVCGAINASEEVPFITTPDNVTLGMLKLAKVTKADHVIDLGSGDGRIVITAAKHFGATGLGVEIVPDLVAKSRANADKAGVSKRAAFAEQDLFKTDLAPASVVTLYLLPEVNMQLRPSLLALKPGTRIVSHDWDMGDWPPDQTETLDVPDKKIGREKLSRIHLWVVPAKVEGLWCGKRGLSLRLTQQFQRVSGQWVRGVRSRQLLARMDGNALRGFSVDGLHITAVLKDDQLHVTNSNEAWSVAAGLLLTRSSGAQCPKA